MEGAEIRNLQGIFMFGDASPPHLERPAAALSRRGARMDGVRAVVRMRTLTARGAWPTVAELRAIRL